jgi:hypothetical protein
MSGYKPYYVDKDKFRVGDDGIIVPIESSLRVHPTAEEEQAVSNSQPHVLTQYTQQLTFEQAMHDMDRGLPPRNIYPEPAARGSHDAQGRLAGYFQGNEEVPQSAEQEQEFPTQEPRSEHPHSYHDEHNRLFDGSGRCLDDLHALQPQSLAAFAPSPFTETAQQQRGNAPALSLTTPSINSELFFNPDDLDLYDDNMNPLGPPPGWQSSAFDDTANVLGTYNQQYGSSYAQHPLSSPSDPVRAAATQRDGPRPLPQQRQQQVSGLDVNASRLYNQWLTSHYQLPPPTGTVNPANLQRDGSGASPGRQQQMPGPDVNASTTYDQPPPYDDSDRGYPLLSPLEDMFSTSADPKIYLVAGSHPTFNTLNTTIHGYLSGPLGSFFTQNAGHQQHQQQHQHHPQQQQNPPYPPNPAGAPPAPQQNHAFDFNPPNDHVYNPFHKQNNQTQHPSYANAAPTAPANPGTQKAQPHPPRAPGAKVGKPIPADLAPLVKALSDLPDVSSTQRHPVRKTLKMPFLTTKKTEAQQVIRDNFVSGTGFLRTDSVLRSWDGDLNVFSKEVWDFLIQGQPRMVERDEYGKRKTKRAKKAEGDEGGEVKKQKTKMKTGDAAKVEVAGADVGEENAAEG